MNNFVVLIIGIVYQQMSSCQGSSAGVGAFSYSDSSGNRYGGTYDLEDGKVIRKSGDAISDIPKVKNFNYNMDFFDNNPFWIQPFPRNLNDFFPKFFNNFEDTFQDFSQRSAFKPFPPLPSFHRHNMPRELDDRLNIERLAFEADERANDLGSYEFGDISNLIPRFPPFHNMEFPMPFFRGDNAAFAAAAAGPGYARHFDAINPVNPMMPNIDITNRINGNRDKPEFYSVKSSSFASSSNVNGKEIKHRKAETYVNNNGDVTQYRVES